MNIKLGGHKNWGGSNTLPFVKSAVFFGRGERLK
jgi:hypothetical protein